MAFPVFGPASIESGGNQVDVFDEESSICRSAILAGVITNEGGDIYLKVRGGADNYPSTDKNGIQSVSKGATTRSFEIAMALPMATLRCFDTRFHRMQFFSEPSGTT